jgi:hypothetical protein
MSRRDVLTRAVEPVAETIAPKPGPFGFCEVCGGAAVHSVRDQRQTATGTVQPTAENGLTKAAEWSQRVSEDHAFCEEHNRKSRYWTLDGKHTRFE